MSDEKVYRIYVKNHGYVNVTKDVYDAYYKHKEHNRYLLKKARECTVSYEQQNEFGPLFEYLFAKDDVNLLDQLIEEEKFGELYDAISQLKDDEQGLIFDIYFKGLSERQVSDMIGLTQQAIHYRKTKALKKLKEFLTNKKS